MKTKLLARLAFLMALAQVVLILVSWIIAAAMPSAAVRSLLSTEGIRWFFGRFTSNLSSPLLVWLLLLAVAWGAWRTSGLPQALRMVVAKRPLSFRQRFAFQLVVAEAIVFLAVISLLTLPSHAILASATGTLFPSSFSRSLVPIVAFAVSAVSLSFAAATGACPSLQHAFRMLTVGISRSAPLWLILILALQLFHSFLFVFFR
jgi:aminobenzoyl-glutamate transport protein